MKSAKKAAAVLLSLCTALSCASCGENTATAMTVDGKDIRAGVYLYYVTTAYNDAIRELTDQGESFDECKTTDDVKKIMKNINLDGVPVEEWIQNKAVRYCQTFIEVENEFDELGLSFTGQELAAIDSSIASSKTYLGDFYEATGIGDQSIREIVTFSYKQNALWDAYYGEGGSVGVEESRLYDYYADNHLRVKYIEMPLKDGEGNLLKADGKAEIEEMANDYLARLAKKSGNEADLMAEFDYLSDEHQNYVTSLSAAAVTTTDDQGNTITTETTAKSTTTEAATTTTGDETTGEGGETTTAPAETTTAGEETTTTTVTTTAATETTTTLVGEETTTTTTTTFAAIGYDTSKERILTVSTAPAETQKADETTTEPTYTPSEKVYNWFADESTPLNQPELIKDDECYYIAVKLNIEDRMTSDDLWTDSAKESVRSTLFNEEFENMLDDKGSNLSVTRNEKAFRRYKVLDVDVVEYQSALMASYYAQYGISN